MPQSREAVGFGHTQCGVLHVGASSDGPESVTTLGLHPPHMDARYKAEHRHHHGRVDSQGAKQEHQRRHPT